MALTANGGLFDHPPMSNSSLNGSLGREGLRGVALERSEVQEEVCPLGVEQSMSVSQTLDLLLAKR